MLSLSITFCSLWPSLKATGCSPSASQERVREVVDSAIYACCGTIGKDTGGVYGDDAEALCGAGYHVCSSLTEAEDLGLTRANCEGIAHTNDEFFATQETSYCCSRCYSVNATADDLTFQGQYFDDVWGCAKPGSSPEGTSPCGALDRATGNGNNGGNYKYWELSYTEHGINGMDVTQMDAKYMYLTNASGGGVLCCKEDTTAAPTTLQTADPTAVPTVDPTTIPTADPTAVPTTDSTAVPTADPTTVRTSVPSNDPTLERVSTANTEVDKSIMDENKDDTNPNKPDETSDLSTNILFQISVAGVVLITITAIGAICVCKQQSREMQKQKDIMAIVVEHKVVPKKRMSEEIPERSNEVVGAPTEKTEIFEWLNDSVQLPQYYDCFVQNGYSSFGLLKTIETKAELRNIGITKVGHQARILNQIREVKDVNSNAIEKSVVSDVIDNADKVAIGYTVEGPVEGPRDINKEHVYDVVMEYTQEGRQ